MKPRWFAILAGVATGWLSVLAPALSPAAAHGPTLRDPALARPYVGMVYATAQPRSEADLARIWDEAENVLEPHDPVLAPHTLVISPATLARLQRAGVVVKVQPIDVQGLVDESYARNEAELLDLDPGGFGPFFAKVQPLDEIEKYLVDLAGRSAGRAKVINIGRSIEGRDIRAMLISSAPDDTARASIIVTSAHHAREWLSPMVAMGLVDGLINRYDSDPRAKKVVDTLNVYIVPVLNPDGYFRTFNGNRLQRKNLRVGCNVDINRNYPTAFGQMVSNNCLAETTRGAMAFSEPETMAVKALAEAQKKLRLYVDYHASGNQVMIPYAFTRDAPPGYAKNKAWGDLLAAQAGQPARPAFNLGQGQGGGALDWFREKFTESLVVELPGRGFDPPASGVAANAELQWKGWLAVADQVASENGGGPAAPTTDAGGSGGAVGGDAQAGGAGGSAPGGATAAAGGATGTGGSVGGLDASAEQPEPDEPPYGCTCGLAARPPQVPWSLTLPLAAFLGIALRRHRRAHRALRPGQFG